jgi:hypothetical protein
LFRHGFLPLQSNQHAARRRRTQINDARPQLTPWVAAVWVDPQARQRGAAPVGRATLDCFALGVAHVYLCVRPERWGFCEKPGWIPIERDVGERHPSAFIRDAIPETKINRSPP